MTSALAIAATPLDDFLEDTGSATATGERLQQIGLVGSLLGITLAVGLVVFLVVVHTGSRREVSTLLRVVAVAGFLTLVGAAVEIAGSASISDLGWLDALSDSAASAPMLRLLAGLLILLGLFEHTVPAAETDEPKPEPEPAPEADDVGRAVRWVPAPDSAFAMVGLVLGVFSFGFDGHTVDEGPRVVHALVNLVHVSSAGVWFGGIVGLVAMTAIRRPSGPSMAPLLVRFSTVAAAELIAVTLAGALMTLMIIDGFGDLTGTEWGRLLLVKVGAVAVVAAIGGYHHVAVVPALQRSNPGAHHLRRVRVTVAAEAALLVFVVVTTVFLSTASTT